MSRMWQSSFTNLVVDTDIMASGDALGAKNSFAGIPERGRIVKVIARDAGKQSVNFDIVFFNTDITGTATNAAFDPTDAELLTCEGAVLVDTWKAFNDNSIGQTPANFAGLPYRAEGGTLYFQCVTRGTPTYVATTDVQVSVIVDFD